MLLFDPYYGHDNVENARVKERTMLKKTLNIKTEECNLIL